MKKRILATLGLLTLLSAGSGLAQAPPGGAGGGPPGGMRGAPAQPLRAKIPFTFHAGDKILPAGEYDFVYNTSSRWGINMRVVAPDGSANVLLSVISRLPGAIHTTPNDAHVGFHRVANTYFLASLWLPNIDGFLVRVSMEGLEQIVVDVPR